MQMWNQFALIIGTLVVATAGTVMFVLLRSVRTAQGPTMQGRYPTGHWMSVGMCVGIAIGCIPSLAGLLIDDTSSWVGIAPAVGLGCGIAIGSALERKHKDELRPLSEQEQQVRFRLTLAALAALALLVLSMSWVAGILFVAPR